MGCLNVLWSVLVGFAVGLVARGLTPGDHAMGFWKTALLGILGSVVGGLIGRLLSAPKEGERFHRAGFWMSVLGAIAVLVLVRLLR